MRYSVAILIFLAALAATAIVISEPQECVTDTECMHMHGGNGDPD